MPRKSGNDETVAVAGTPGREALANTAATDVPSPALAATLASDDPKPNAPGSSGALADTAAPSPWPGLDATMASHAPNTNERLPIGDPRADDLGFLTVSPAHYALGKEIARGGMGRIRVARDRRLGRTIAVKEILVKGGDLARRFEREARITARLQHPSIVSVHEAGVWPSGEPFYSMKLVSGRSLDEVVAEAKTFELRLALLPSVLAIADAMAYAHGERVIHRDLKPKNVLVGAFGETVVIDWGLAKDLSDSSSSPDGGGPFRSSDDAETAVGDVMGTPAYMPPEQAEGQPVDERADVYALGALLDHVLSGSPAYTGANGVAILEAVKRGPPKPLAERQAGVPSDLLAIVERAMARDPVARYPTARELAEDLRRYQTGQLVGAHHYTTWQLVRRWIRRHRTPVAVAAVAAVLLGVLGVVSLQRIVREQARTDDQRQLAEQSRGEAEDVMTFMMDDLHNKLQPLGRTDLLNDVAKKVAAYYDRRGESLSDAELAKRARARRNLGDVLFQQGDATAALREHRASLAIDETLAAKDPTNADWQQNLSISHNKVGDVLFAQGDAAAALAAYKAYLAISETLATNDPTNADWQRNLSVSHNKVGDVLFAQGDAAAALAEYRVSQTIAARLAAMDPTNAGKQADLSVSHEGVGDVLLAQGDEAGALAEYRATLAIRATLAANDPTNADWLQNLSVSHQRVGNVLRDQGDTAAALAEYRASLAILQTLAAKDPTNADRQRDVSISHNKVGDAIGAQGDSAGALREYRASLAIRETLAAKDPTNAVRQRDLSASYIKIADARRAQGDVMGALTEYRASLAIFKTLATKDPTNADRQRDVSISHNKVGDVLLAQRDAAGALLEYRTALAIRETLAAKDPTNAKRQLDLSVSHSNVGDALLAQGDTAGALSEHRASLAILQTLAAKDPTNAARQQDVAASHESIGDALSAQADKSGGIAEYKAALDIVQRLVATDPANADWSKQAASLAAKVATCCGTTKKEP